MYFSRGSTSVTLPEKKDQLIIADAEWLVPDELDLLDKLITIKSEECSRWSNSGFVTRVSGYEINITIRLRVKSVSKPGAVKVAVRLPHLTEVAGALKAMPQPVSGIDPEFLLHSRIDVATINLTTGK